jgi:EAL domain-containing protein (putative c-di-GMP-specific phosphodiesterase class I)/ActR/RegA family two-component response regulator
VSKGPEVPPVRVLIADDDVSIRRMMARLLSKKASIELVGMAADAEEAVELGSRTRPDVALVDVNMPKGGGVRAARELHVCSPETKIVALSGQLDREGVLEMVSSGAVGYLVKGANVDVVQGIMAASRGEGVISNEVAADLMGELGGRLARQREQEESERRKAHTIEEIIEHQAFEIVFEPIVDLKSGKIAGIEALTRFSAEPRRTPNLWFDEAWDLGLGLDLELAVVQAALDTARGREPDVFLTVNVSPQTAVSDRFPQLLAHDFPGSLVIELTEHAVVEDYDMLIRSLDPLRQRGVRVAVDDAGAGYASLRHVLRVKPDFIKLDISLVSGIDEDRSKSSLAESITQFARESRAKVIAEGIETHSQLGCIAALGVSYGQGHLYGRPCPFESIGIPEDDHAWGYLPEGSLRSAPPATVHDEESPVRSIYR